MPVLPSPRTGRRRTSCRPQACCRYARKRQACRRCCCPLAPNHRQPSHAPALCCCLPHDALTRGRLQHATHRCCLVDHHPAYCRWPPPEAQGPRRQVRAPHTLGLHQCLLLTDTTHTADLTVVPTSRRTRPRVAVRATHSSTAMYPSFRPPSPPLLLSS